MTAAAKRTSQSTIPAPADDDDDDRDEITIERRVKVPAPPCDDATHKTTRMSKHDSRLLAIARGELAPEDPFGGLIPIYDDDDAAAGIEDGWLVLRDDTYGSSSSDEGILSDTIPTLRVSADQLLALRLEPWCTLFLAQVDGVRTVQELASICELDDLSALEIVDDLLRVGAIDLH